MNNNIIGRYLICKRLLLLASLFLAISTAQAQPFGELIPFWADHEERSSLRVDHSAWQEILTTYVNDQHPSGVNRFDYDGVSDQDKSRLTEYLAYMQSIEPRQLNLAEQQAYWINLYNSATVNIIIDNIDDITSIRQIRSGIFKPGPWQLDVLYIAGQDVSLDDIEHGILRPIWRDNRIHYAVNCASIGCPNLLKTAFTADNVEQLLEEGAVAYINNQRGVSVSGGELTLSSIFNWYAEDFGSSFQELIAHLSQYANPELAFRLESFSDADYDYDWSLNQ